MKNMLIAFVAVLCGVVIILIGFTMHGRSIRQVELDNALKSSMEEAIFSRSVAVTTSDIENTKFIKMVASGFYKMGVEIPENVCLEVAYNRDEEKVHDELMGGTNVVQYDVLSDLD